MTNEIFLKFWVPDTPEVYRNMLRLSKGINGIVQISGSEESASSPVVPRSSSSARKKKYAPNDQGRYVCTQCNRSYAAYHNLMRHMRYECGLPPRFPCNVCGRFFRRKDDLQRHIARIHGMLDVSLDGVKPDE